MYLFFLLHLCSLSEGRHDITIPQVFLYSFPGNLIPSNSITEHSTVVIPTAVSLARTFLLDSGSVFANCLMDSCSSRFEKNRKLSMIKSEFTLTLTSSQSHLSSWQGIMCDPFSSLTM